MKFSAQEIVNKRKKIHELIASEAKYRSIVNNSFEMIYLHDVNGNILEVNRAAVSRMGYTEEEILQKTIFDLHAEDTEAQEIEKIKEQWKKWKIGERIVLERKHKSKNGDIIPVEISTGKISFQEKEYILAFARDITARKKMEKTLWKEKENLRITLDSIGDAVIVTDTEGQVTRMNPVAEQLTGWSFAEARGNFLTEVFNIVNAKTRKPVQNPVKKVLKTGKIVGLANHTLLIARDGSEYQIADSAAPIDDREGNINGVVLIFRDVTDEYRMQEEIKRQKNFLASILEVQSGLVVLLDPEGRIVRFNRACEELTGYNFTEIEGEKIWDVLIREQEKEEVEQVFSRLKAKNYPNKYKNYWVTKEGELRLISWSNNVILNDENEIEYIVGTGIDITELKEQKEKIKYMSYHDNLTDLYNRSYIEKELKRLEKKKQLPLSVIMLDINGLKVINDTYGHKKGDQVLIKVAEVLEKKVNDRAIVARWSGDEFVLLFPRTSGDKIREICENINEQFKFLKYNDIPITAGIGMATRTELGQSIYNIFYAAEEDMYQDKLTRNRSARNKLVRNLLNTLGAKSDETREHAGRMTKYAQELGKVLGLSHRELNNLSLLAALHDIGKVTISEKILTKPAGLTDEEWEIVKKHTEKGYEIVASTKEFIPIAESILYHHERWDGKGYPKGLKGEEIPLLARIISIVDAYDVMTNGRPYKEPLSKEEALEEIKMCAGTQFDPKLAEEFVNLMAK